MTRPPPRPPLFPYTTLFRSPQVEARAAAGLVQSEFVAKSAAAQDYGLEVTGGSEHASYHLGGTYRKMRSEEHTSELQSLTNLVCRLLLDKKKETTGTRAEPN